MAVTTSHWLLATYHPTVVLLYFAKPWAFFTHSCFRGTTSWLGLRLSTSFAAGRIITGYGSFSSGVGLARWFIFLPKFCPMPDYYGKPSKDFPDDAEFTNSRPSFSTIPLQVTMKNLLTFISTRGSSIRRANAMTRLYLHALTRLIPSTVVVSPRVSLEISPRR